MKFKLFKWEITHLSSLEDYIEILAEKGWITTGSTIIRTNSNGDPIKVILSCYCDPSVV